MYFCVSETFHRNNKSWTGYSDFSSSIKIANRVKENSGGHGNISKSFRLHKSLSSHYEVRDKFTANIRAMKASGLDEDER